MTLFGFGKRTQNNKELRYKANCSLVISIFPKEWICPLRPLHTTTIFPTILAQKSLRKIVHIQIRGVMHTYNVFSVISPRF